MNDNNFVQTTSLLNWWFESKHSDFEERELFIYIDFAMKYVHNRGFCVKTFDPREIEILNNSPKQVKFNVLLKMPEDVSERNKLKNEDVFNSALLQIGLYYAISKDTFYKINCEYVKKNFDNFIPFLPDSDIPYYRGIVERGASVYFTDFELERVKRENANIEKELNELDDKSKNEIHFTMDNYRFSNDEINKVIYKQINDEFVYKQSSKNLYKKSAFLNLHVIPIIFIILLVVFIILFLIYNL